MLKSYISYGIIYAEADEAEAKREEVKKELQAEYDKNDGQEPEDDFINKFCKKHNVCLPSDVVFDEDAFMQ